MRKFNITVKKIITITEVDLNDILCSCFEGGCSYWACLDNSTKEWRATRECLIKENGERPTIEDIMVRLLCEGQNIEIIDEEEDTRYAIDLNMLIQGIEQAISENFWDGNDICDIDGEVGDAIIQYAVFNELVYG